jgi:hypothetical protein
MEGDMQMRTQRKSVLILIMSLAFFALPIFCFAAENGSKEAKISRAMEAAPDSITKNATIIDVDGTVLRQGTNGWQCLPASAAGSHPMCNDEVWVRLMTAVANKTDFKTEKVGISYMLAGDDNINNADPYDTKPDPGEVWVQEGPHLMIVVPDPKMLEGLPDDPYKGGPYVMWKGTPYAHIMIPVGPREK